MFLINIKCAQSSNMIYNGLTLQGDLKTQHSLVINKKTLIQINKNLFSTNL